MRRPKFIKSATIALAAATVLYAVTPFNVGIKQGSLIVDTNSSLEITIPQRNISETNLSFGDINSSIIVNFDSNFIVADDVNSGVKLFEVNSSDIIDHEGNFSSYLCSVEKYLEINWTKSDYNLSKDSNITIKIDKTKLKNPQVTGAYPMGAYPIEINIIKTENGTTTITDTNLTVLDVRVAELNISNTTPGNNTAGIDTNYTIDFNSFTHGYIPKDVNLTITFPSGFNISNSITSPGAVKINGNSVALVAKKAQNILTFTLPNDLELNQSQNNRITIADKNITNPTTSSNDYNITIEANSSYINYGFTISSNTFTIIPYDTNSSSGFGTGEFNITGTIFFPPGTAHKKNKIVLEVLEYTYVKLGEVNATARSDANTTFDYNITGLPAGSYIIRIPSSQAQIGAGSALDLSGVFSFNNGAILIGKPSESDGNKTLFYRTNINYTLPINGYLNPYLELNSINRVEMANILLHKSEEKTVKVFVDATDISSDGYGNASIELLYSDGYSIYPVNDITPRPIPNISNTHVEEFNISFPSGANNAKIKAKLNFNQIPSSLFFVDSIIDAIDKNATYAEANVTLIKNTFNFSSTPNDGNANLYRVSIDSFDNNNSNRGFILADFNTSALATLNSLVLPTIKANKMSIGAQYYNFGCHYYYYYDGSTWRTIPFGPYNQTIPIVTNNTPKYVSNTSMCSSSSSAPPATSGGEGSYAPPPPPPQIVVIPITILIDPTNPMVSQINISAPNDAAIKKDGTLGITIVEAKPIQISPELISIATTTISNIGAIASKIEIKDNIGASIQTIIEAPKGVDVAIGTDGSIKQTLFIAKTENVEFAKTNVVAKPTGEVEVRIQSLQKAGDTSQVRELAAPAGAKMEMKDDGSTITKSEVKSSAGESIKTEIVAKPTGELAATVVIPSLSVSLLVSVPKIAEEAKIEFIKLSKSRAVSNQYDALLSKFKSSRSFVAYEKTKSSGTVSRNIIPKAISKLGSRSLLTANKIEIVPNSAWQTFNEIQSFDGTRTIKLILGRAKMVVDGEEFDMEPNKEYQLPALTQDSSSTTQTESADSIISTITTKSWPISGYFYQVEPKGAWDWVYCVANTDSCYRLIGFDTKTGGFTYLGGDNPTKVAKPNSDFSGYFINYNPKDAYAWIYTEKKTNKSFKLGGDSNGINWQKPDISNLIETKIDEAKKSISYSKK